MLNTKWEIKTGIRARYFRKKLFSIEQDADVILFIYRDEYYHEDSPDKGIAELIIGKQRNGEIGTCRAAFIGKYTRFDNLAPEYFQNDGY